MIAEDESFIDKLFGKRFGDKGYLSRALFLRLVPSGYSSGYQTTKKYENQLLKPMSDAILLRKRAICEIIIDQLKNIFQIEHSRHRSSKNFLTNQFRG